MAKATIDHLIINSPYEEPKSHWKYDRERRLFELEEGRRPAGYIVASERSQSHDDPGILVKIPLVNRIRPRVKAWREEGYPGVTGITRTLLEYWHNPDEREYRRFFFCQLEAIETLIWLTEAPEPEKVGIEIPSDGGSFKRICSKMATGSGKTVVMAMLIAWQVLNKMTYPQDSRFSKYILVVAPGLTVRSRLRVLVPKEVGNYYEEFNIVPHDMNEKLRRSPIRIINWHALNWETEEQMQRKKSVEKRGPKSDEAYVREVLKESSRGSNIIVINDEAHHAWRINVEAVGKYLRTRDMKDSAEEATIWIGGLDRIHRARSILTCYDFTATPFTPSGKRSTEESLFSWIVSDFGLNDAIESGLVKTPRVVIRDDGIPDAKTYRSKLYHIYEHVKDDLNRKSKEHEPLPDLVINGYYLLGRDWLETLRKWEDKKFETPPVMISVANRTETAARIKYSFEHRKIRIDELCEPEKILHIDSRVLKEAEEEEGITYIADESDKESDESPKRTLSKTEIGELLRQKVDTVGQKGKSGEQIQNVISVGMLSEGWDAKTVTHIMGLRAFTSQLLCEQVVGRGLRRTSYEINDKNGLLDPEYVNIFGVPFTFLPHEIHDGPPPSPPSPKTLIEPVIQKQQYEITWPDIIRINHVYRPSLELSMDKIEVLQLNAGDTPMLAELAPIADGKPDFTKITTIDLEKLGRENRLQKIIFETARDLYDEIKPEWKADKSYLLIQLIKLVERFLSSGKIHITPNVFQNDEIKRRVLLTLNMEHIVRHMWEAIRFENTESLEPIFDRDHPIRSTRDMRPWFTARPCGYTQKSHINMCTYESTWEANEAYELDHNPNVKAWVKNDHLGFEIFYVFKGEVRKYRPDFIIHLENGAHLILEVKGQEREVDKTKRGFLDEWVKAVNQHGDFGMWRWDVSRTPSDVKDIIEKAMRT